MKRRVTLDKVLFFLKNRLEQQLCPTCHNSCVVLTGFKGTLALPCLHLHPSILGLLQGEGGHILPGDRKRIGEITTTMVIELLN